jgi:hypothetical protein
MTNKPRHPQVTKIEVTHLRVGLGVSAASPERQATPGEPIMPKWQARLVVLGTVIGSLLLVAWWHGYP